jgi:hypothetical protein
MTVDNSLRRDTKERAPTALITFIVE